MTWALRASTASRRPISTAARPPTPASTSSNTNVGTGSAPASTTSRASITRDSSPPEAPLATGRAGAPACGESCSSTSSAPCGPTATRRVAPSSSTSIPSGSSRWLSTTSSRAFGMASWVSSPATSSAEPGRRDGPLLVQPAGQLAQLGAQRVALGAQLLHPPLVVVQLEQPSAGPRPPGQHVRDVRDVLAVLLLALVVDALLAVAAHQRAELGPTFLDDGQPGRVGLDPGGVRREVGGHVGHQEPQLAQAGTEAGQHRVVVGHRVDGVPGRRQQLGRTRLRRRRAVQAAAAGGRVGDERGVRAVRGRAQRVGVREAGVVVAQLVVLPRLRVDRLDLLQRGAQPSRPRRRAPGRA